MAPSMTAPCSLPTGLVTSVEHCVPLFGLGRNLEARLYAAQSSSSTLRGAGEVSTWVMTPRLPILRLLSLPRASRYELCSMSNPVAGGGGAGSTGTLTVVLMVAPAEFTPDTVKLNAEPVSADERLTVALNPSPAGAIETFESSDDHAGTEPACNAPFGVAVNAPLPPTCTPVIAISHPPSN